MQLLIRPDGNLQCLYEELVDLRALGTLIITRASTVEPDATGSWWVDLSLSSGPCLGPYEHRSAALAAERRWLEDQRLS